MSSEYHSRNLDHLGIVSQICDDIGIVKTIDKMIPPDPSMKLSHGECVKLMIINGLGFTSRPLYLEAQFWFIRQMRTWTRVGDKVAILNIQYLETHKPVFSSF